MPPIVIVVALTPGVARCAPKAAVTAMPATIAAPARTARTLLFIPIRTLLRMVEPGLESQARGVDYDSCESDLIVVLTREFKAPEEAGEAVREQEHDQDDDQSEDDVLAVAEPITGTSGATEGRRPTKTAPTSDAPERAEPGHRRSDQDLEGEQDAELARLHIPVRAITSREPATPANAAEMPNASVL